MNHLYSDDEFKTVNLIGQSNIEEFRYKAAQALKSYTKTQRKWTRQLGHKVVLDFYQTYSSTLHPLFVDLAADSPQHTLAKQLQKSLQMDESRATHTVAELVFHRKNELVAEFVTSLPKKSRKRACAVLSLPVEKIDSLEAAYKNARLFNDAAKQSNIAILDCHRGLVWRFIAVRRIKGQRQKLEKSELAKLRQLDSHLNAIDTQEGDILRRMMERRFDLMPLLALRNAFEKEESKTKSQTSGAARLKTFEKTAKAFIEAHTTDSPVHPWQTVSDKIKTMQLLADVFELDNKSTNRFVLIFSDYAKFYHEKQDIIAQRERRVIFVNKAD